MATTYILLSSFVASGGETSVTFSSISQSYNDLVLRGSARDAAGAGTVQALRLQINSDTNTNYSNTQILATGTSSSSSRSSNQTTTYLGSMNQNGATANNFSSIEIYIPAYTNTNNKPLSTFQVAEDNSNSGDQTGAIAGYYRTSSAISSLQLQPNGSSFAAGSSFYLYGIKNS